VDLLSLDDDFSSPAVSSGLSASAAEKLRTALKTAAIVKGLNSKTQLIDNDQLEISVASDYRAHQGRIAIAIYNKGNSDLRNVEFSVANSDALNVRVQAPSQRISPGDEGRVQIAIECLKPFREAPLSTLSFSVNQSNFKYEIPLPVSVPSFCVPLPSDKATYMNRWKAITAENTEAQQVFSSGRPVSPELLNFVRNTLMPAMSVANAEGLDSDKTFTGSTTFMTGTVGPEGKPIAVGALLRLEGEPAHNKFRITVRATHPAVSQAIKDFIVTQLS
jgi:hypothetical protein